METEPKHEAAATPGPGPRARRRFGIVRVGLVLGVIVLAWPWLTAGVYGASTIWFIGRMNTLGRTLKAGEIGVVRIPRLLADEIILVAPYSPHGPTSGFRVDSDCMLVWMRGRGIASTVVFPASWIEFEMEGYPSPQMWRLDPRGEIHLELVYNSLETKGGIATFRFPDPVKLHRVNETPREVEKP